MDQRFASVGADDPCLNKHGKIDLCLAQQARCWKKRDKPSVCVKPILVTIVMAVLMHALVHFPSMEKEAVANMVFIAFYYCMRPGEYTATMSDDQAFALDDVAVFIGSWRLNNKFCSNLELEAATHSTFCFTKQKNQHKDDVIAHATSGDVLFCPVKAMV